MPEEALQALATDRRLANRVLAHWLMARGNQLFPRRSHIDPKAFGKDWVNCVVIQIGKEIERSRVLAIGQNLRLQSWSPTIPTRIGDYSDSSLLRLTTAEIPTLLEQRELISFDGSAVHKGRPILYRSILLPLSEDDVGIDGVLGAINFRVADPVRDGDKIEPSTIEVLRLNRRGPESAVTVSIEAMRSERRWEALKRHPVFA